jgi:hypothetical protein
VRYPGGAGSLKGPAPFFIFARPAQDAMRLYIRKY